jgi:hypothetical protein
VPKVVVHISWQGRTTFTLDDEYVVRHDGEKVGEQGGDFTRRGALATGYAPL